MVMIFAVIVFLVILYVVRRIAINIAFYFAARVAIKNPTKENAEDVYKMLKAFLGVKIKSSDKEKYKDMFYKINQSSDIPGELKFQIKELLIKKGLDADSVEIIDNYEKKTEYVIEAE